jgi:two-component system, NtrC family, response regulator HupR/HoxA
MVRPMGKNYCILFVDDEPEILESLRLTFTDDYPVQTARSGEEALAVAKDQEVGVVLADQRMPGMTGIELLQKVKALKPDAVRMILTAYTDVEALLSAINTGEVYRYLTKPWEPADLVGAVRQAGERYELLRENRRLFQELDQAHLKLRKDYEALRGEIVQQYQFEEIIGRSRAMEKLFEVLRRVADSMTTLLLLGETGVGKEVVAKAVHYSSSRRHGKFVIQNCGALPDNLLESELFGHRKGSFTGASADKKGLFEEADQGTIFLDEIAETSPAMQVRLLRVLQEGEFRRVGDTESRRTDARVIAATNRNLEADVKAGRFREDLFYRLNVLPIRIPPLRERPDDIPLLAHHFLDKACRKSGRTVLRIDEDAMSMLERYPFPGNARELQNELERAVMLAPGEVVTADLLSPRIWGEDVTAGQVGSGDDLNRAVDQLKRLLISRAMKAEGNKTKAAARLGLTRQSLQQMMKRLGME